MTDTGSIKRHGVSVASNYIIALDGADAGKFIVCEPTLVVERGEGWGGLTADQIDAYIKQHMLRAAPLPGRPLEAAEFNAGPGR